MFPEGTVCGNNYLNMFVEPQLKDDRVFDAVVF